MAQQFPLSRETYRGDLYRNIKVTISTDPTKPVGPFKRSFENAQKKAGVQLRWHYLRHSAASLMAAGMTPDFVMDAEMGWDLHSKMRARYSHATIAAKQAAANLMLDIK